MDPLPPLNPKQVSFRGVGTNKDIDPRIVRFLKPGFSDDAKRKFKRGGQKIDPNSELAQMKDKIESFIEKPCLKMVKLLMSEGKETYWSNAFGRGLKGVYWREKTEESNIIQHYFSSIRSGRTYKVDDGQEYSPSYNGQILNPGKVLLEQYHNPGIDFSEALPSFEDYS